MHYVLFKYKFQVLHMSEAIDHIINFHIWKESSKTNVSLIKLSCSLQFQREINMFVLQNSNF